MILPPPELGHHDRALFTGPGKPGQAISMRSGKPGRHPEDEMGLTKEQPRLQQLWRRPAGRRDLLTAGPRSAGGQALGHRRAPLRPPEGGGGGLEAEGSPRGRRAAPLPQRQPVWTSLRTLGRLR